MKSAAIFLLLLVFVLPEKLISQVIPIGTSVDSLLITTPPNTSLGEGKYGIHYYKPASYNSLASPILFFIHGTGGNGTTSLDLQTIADRQNALIVAPTMHNGYGGHAYVSEDVFNSITGCAERLWSTQVLKSIYRHVLNRESRSSIDSYLTGFSAGGQFVTRYMLIRQFSPDSIPIKMAVSVNPSNYTLMTDTFNNVQMLWINYRCGLAGYEYFKQCSSTTYTTAVKDFICNEHVKQYYNENYGVLIGAADTAKFGTFCPSAQGTDRFDRAKKFYSFSTTNAVTRGTTLKWVMDSVVNVGHDQINMYNTKRNSTDTFTIAERLLFKTPFHIVQQFTPTCIGGVGIKELTADAYHVSIYPNPNTGTFVLKIDKEIKNGELIIFNSIGEEVHSQKIIQGANDVSTNNLSNGLYSYILYQNKQKVKSGKLILE